MAVAVPEVHLHWLALPFEHAVGSFPAFMAEARQPARQASSKRTFRGFARIAARSFAPLATTQYI
jgi:hypothetical protein